MRVGVKRDDQVVKVYVKKVEKKKENEACAQVGAALCCGTEPAANLRLRALVY